VLYNPYKITYFVVVNLPKINGKYRKRIKFYVEMINSRKCNYDVSL